MPISASQPNIFDKPRAQQMPFNSLAELQHADELSRRIGMDSSAFNPLAIEGGRLINPNLSELNRDYKSNDPLRSAPITGLSERAGYPSQNDFFQPADIRRNVTPPNSQFTLSPVSPYEGQVLNNQTTYSAGKGSRMAKHFEKQRDINVGQSRNAPMQNMGLNALPNRHEQPPQSSNVAAGGRNIQDLLTMLSNSAQVSLTPR